MAIEIWNNYYDEEHAFYRTDMGVMDGVLDVLTFIRKSFYIFRIFVQQARKNADIKYSIV